MNNIICLAFTMYRHKLGTKDTKLKAQSLFSEFPYPTKNWGEYKFSNNLEL